MLKKIEMNLQNNQLYVYLISSSSIFLEIIFRYEEKYVNLKMDICKLLVNILEETKFNYKSNYGIFYV